MQNSMTEHFDYLFKIVLIGDSAVGKTNLLSQLVYNRYLEDCRATIGVEFGTMTFKIDNKVIKAQIWDTAGQERYQAITHAYYRGSYGSIIVYDITQLSTFKRACDMWFIQLRNYTENIPVMLIGNKNDLEEYRVVKKEDATARATANNMMFFETSAKTGENVQKAFFELINMIYKKHIEKETKSRNKKQKTEFVGREVKPLKPRKKKSCC